MTFQGRVASGAVCAEQISLEVTAPGARGASRSTVVLALGMRLEKVDSLEDGAAGWQVNPDGKDTGEAGRWALGTPPRSVAFDYVLQPGAAFSGTHAFVTGLGAEQTDNVEGRTTLESPAFALAGLREPQLSYQVYFVSADFQDEVLIPSASGSLRVEASVDGGPWVEVDRAEGLTTGWQRRIVPLAAAIGARAPIADDGGAVARGEDGGSPADAAASSTDGAAGTRSTRRRQGTQGRAPIRTQPPPPSAGSASASSPRRRPPAPSRWWRPSSTTSASTARHLLLERPDGGDEPPGVDGSADGKRRTDPGGLGAAWAATAPAGERRPWCCWRWRWCASRGARGTGGLLSAPGDAKPVAGVLYVVSSPLGNPADLSPRALSTLAAVDVGLRRGHPLARRLLEGHGIDRPTRSCFDANEPDRAQEAAALLAQGQSLALLSEAGTPAVSDPGYRVIRAAIEAGARVVPCPARPRCWRRWWRRACPPIVSSSSAFRRASRARGGLSSSASPAARHPHLLRVPPPARPRPWPTWRRCWGPSARRAWRASSPRATRSWCAARWARWPRATSASDRWAR
jgi:hypothetical protein